MPHYAVVIRMFRYAITHLAPFVTPTLTLTETDLRDKLDSAYQDRDRKGFREELVSPAVSASPTAALP